jgi:hypothetical protein
MWSWSDAEDQFILHRVQRGLSNRQIWEQFREQFPGKRSLAAVAKRRTSLSATPSTKPATNVLEDITVTEDGDDLEIQVAASCRIKTVDDLIKAAKIDLTVWDVRDGEARSHYVPMKVDDQPIVVETRYVRVRFRRKATDLFDLAPAVVKIVRPKVPRSRKATADVSVHFSDVHYPHHDPRTLSILHQILEITDPTVVVDHGDTLDAEQLGRWAKDPERRVSLADEIRMGVEHFGQITALTRPDCRHVWLEGNHEDRLRRTIWDMADRRAAGELLTLSTVREALQWGSLLGLDSLGWEQYPYQATHDRRNFCLLFDRIVCKHGASTGAHPAQAEFKKYGKSGISGHTHKMGSHHHRDWNGQLRWTCLGLMGRIREDYVDHAAWQQSLAVVTWSKDKSRWGMEHVQIIDGQCYFRGNKLVAAIDT